MPCHWIKDKELGPLHIPGCMGAAVYGPRGCTCGVKGSRRALEAEIESLKERVRELEAKK